LFVPQFANKNPFPREWNNLVERSTTKKEDVHCILANMLGISDGDILNLWYEERMKAILGAQGSLPLHLLAKSGPRLQGGFDRWIPLYPDGGLSDAYGEMKVTPTGLVFGRETACCIGFIVDATRPRLSKFRLLEPSGPEPIWVRLAGEGSDTGFEGPGSIATCYVFGETGDPRFGRPHPNRRNRGKVFYGASFAVEKNEGSCLNLIYEHPLSYCYWRPRNFDATGRYIEDPADYPTIEATRLAADSTYQVSCGKSSLSA
jgi:hypothetical protein